MARITKEQKNDVRYYAWEINLNPLIADACSTREEIDAAVECVWLVEQYADKYRHAVALAPKDPAKKQKALRNKLSKTKSQQEHYDTVLEWRAASPSHSNIKNIKYEVLNTCIDILKNANFDNACIKKIIPALTWHLAEDDELLQEPDQRLIDLIKSF